MRQWNCILLILCLLFGLLFNASGGGITPPETETETATPPQTEEEEKAELIRRIYEETQGRQRVIAWGIPEDIEYLPGALQLMQEAGITGVLTCNEIFGETGLYGILTTAGEMGMDVYINAQNLEPSTMLYRLEMYAGYLDCVKGIMLRDEPIEEQYASLAELKCAIENAYPDSGWDIGANMFPSKSLDYVYRYATKTNSDFLSFDHYPYRTNGDLGAYLGNFLMVKYMAERLGDKEVWTYLQTASISGSGDPTYEEMLCEAHLSLAAGADVLELFLVGETPNGEDIDYWISYDNQTNQLYEDGKAVFTRIQKMKGVYLEYRSAGLILLNAKAMRQTVVSYGMNEYLLSGYGHLRSAESLEKTAVGCMKNRDGGEGFYAVNLEVERTVPSEVTLNFDTAVNYQIWGSEGLEDIGRAEKLTLSIDPGDGKFVKLVD